MTDYDAKREPGDYASTLGCHEMELAAKRVMAEANDDGEVGGREFLHRHAQGYDPPRTGWRTVDSEAIGLMMLLAHGWLRPGYPNGTFEVTPSLVRRLVEHNVTLPDKAFVAKART